MLVIHGMVNIDELVNSWLNTSNIHHITCYREPESTNEVNITICDDNESRLYVIMYLDGISSPDVTFVYKGGTPIFYEGDVSIYESILKLISKYAEIYNNSANQ